MLISNSNEVLRICSLFALFSPGMYSKTRLDFVTISYANINVVIIMNVVARYILQLFISKHSIFVVVWLYDDVERASLRTCISRCMYVQEKTS